ncbi:unnamed protein product [Calicophoron daubneyi]|uniref:Uncharacterized protein n=1 Tax=Calicophoron daubneyi TaxID=300641 RepID=A0AAV2TV01_CALDB
MCCIKYVIAESLLKVERSEGYRIERIGVKGVKVNFSWIRTDDITSWLKAAEKCSSTQSSLPKASEMRYFYKTLRSDDAKLYSPEGLRNQTVNGVAFYLADVLEATMDYPNTESGERMCLVVEKRPNTQVHLAETTAVRSCLTPVNLLVCKSPLETDEFGISQHQHMDNQYLPCNAYADQWVGPQPQWVIDLKQKAEIADHQFCFKPDIFYASLSLIGVLILLTTIISAVLAVRYHQSMQKLKRATREPNEDYLLSSSSVAASEAAAALNNIEAGAGRLDILADSEFYRAPENMSRESYKQALINEGYQRLSNGLTSSLRASRTGQSMRESNSMSSLRRSQQRR